MTEMIICDEKKSESDALEKDAINANARASDTKLRINVYRDQSDCLNRVSGKLPADMALLEVPDSGDTIVPEKVRQDSEDTSIMLIADDSVPPMRYVTPKIRACSLLQRPYSEKQRKETVTDFVKDYYQRVVGPNDRCISVKFGGEIERIPVAKIVCVETKRNKVIIRMSNSEFVEYKSLDSLMEELGSDFIRCHRSFAFNKNWFVSVKLSENKIKLAHGISVPLSRTYKKNIREFIKEDE